MRHLWSFLGGLVVAPLCWLLVAVGQKTSIDTIDGWVADGGYHTVTLIAPAAYLFTAGLILGLLGTLRVSPGGPLVAGLLLAAPYVMMFIAPLRARDVIGTPWRLLGEPIELLRPVENGTLATIGVLLCVAALSRQRWRTWPRADDEPRTTPATPSADPLPVRPVGEFDPTLWSLPGGTGSSARSTSGPAPAQSSRPSTATLTATTPDSTSPSGGATATATDEDADTDTDTDGSGDDSGRDRLRPARPNPRSIRPFRR
ncbi:hypothetical protein O7632_07075 [Solwaraspora sp. WMMD406]|uniref:hypothetical protein n=1 Tax=Solwaraspora sp. WMMD406 TaxID=3016095 RepID=UPI0024178537|nr:hypothetical protein [Solwaraspora sp. WMMD406]MDG4763870.1 hypothetical protein [Solwaraspora sp. WMMD406]